VVEKNTLEGINLDAFCESFEVLKAQPMFFLVVNVLLVLLFANALDNA